MEQTSLLSYTNIKESGILSYRQNQVYDLLKQSGPMSSYEIAARLGLPINCITGRVLELRRNKKVVVYDQVKNPITKNLNTRYAI